MVKSKFTYMPNRGWMVFIACLEKPRSLKEISKELGYRSQATFSNKYEGKSLTEWMIEHNFLKMAGKNGREIKYSSNIYYFFKGDMWESEWVRSSIFKLDNIKTLYNYETEGNRAFEILSNMFLKFIAAYVTLIRTSVELGQMKKNNLLKDFSHEELFYIDKLFKILRYSYANMNIGGYHFKVTGIMSKHKEDILKLYEDFLN